MNRLVGIIPERLLLVRFSTLSDELAAKEWGITPVRLLYASIRFWS